MAQTFKITGTLTLPEDDGEDSAPIDLGLSFVFTQRANFDLSFDTLTTDYVVSLGTLSGGGAKALFIKSSSGGCSVKLNGSTDSLDIDTSGYMLYTAPSGGVVTQISVSVVGIAKVKILAVA